MDMTPKTALIVGAGAGLSASLARLMTANGVKVALAARQTDKLEALCQETGAVAHACDAASPTDVRALFSTLDEAFGTIDSVVYNPSKRVRGTILDIDPDEVANAVAVTAIGGLCVAQEAARRMLPKGGGSIIFTGASAGWKGFARSTAFAMGKFAQRGLAQSLARELQPQGIHVAVVNIDGAILPANRDDDGKQAQLDPDAIAQTYWHLICQPRSTWSTEVELRPWVEKF